MCSVALRSRPPNGGACGPLPDGAPAELRARTSKDRWRVAFFVHRFPVVSEVFIMNSAAALLDDGHEVEIFALEGPGAAQQEPQHAMVSHDLGNRAASSDHGADRMRRIRRAPAALGRALSIHGAAALTTLNPLAFGRAALNLKAVYQAGLFRARGSYDVLHCQFANLAPAVLSHRAAGFVSGPLVVHFRGFDISETLRRRGSAFYARTFREADAFAANCEHFRERAAEAGCDRSRIGIVPTGIELARFPFRERRRPVQGPLRIATVGRLVEKKGVRYAIEATAKLMGQGHDLEHVIIGDGPLRADLEALAASLGQSRRIHFAGARAHAAIADELARAHIFLSPSVTSATGDQDAPTNTLKEAMASGLPVVSTRHGGIPELVEDGVSGLLAPERDSDALADRLAFLIGNPEACAEMGRRGRASVVARYDAPVAHARLLAVYSSAIERWRRR